MFGFERLAAWQKSVDFAGRIYDITRSFPVDERFGLTSQWRRAAVSISSNIAEGSGRSSNKEFIRFLEIAYGSPMEVVSQVHVSNKQSLISNEVHLELQQRAEELAKMLSGLKSSLLKRSKPTNT